MQPSTSVCNDSNKSAPCIISNWPDNRILYGNFLGRDSVSVQETSKSDVSPAFGGSDRMEVINPMYLGTNHQSTAICSRRSLKRAWGAFLPLAMDIIKCSVPLSEWNPSADVDIGGAEQRLCSRNDDEYPPSSSLDITCQQNPDPLPTISTRGASTSSSRANKRPRTDGRTHGSAPSRNMQATSDQVEDIRVKLSLCRMNRERIQDLICPVTGCQYKQLNGRVPDFRRHIRTHIRNDGEIRCKGVPWQKFIRHRHLYPKISMDQRPYAVPDEDGEWIGGCLKTFSRADALKRHLRNTSCVGHNQNRRR